jgi:hypothetical protein
MDERMDAGMLSLEECRLFPIEEKVSFVKLEQKEFSTVELVGIMDELLSALVTWQRGHSAMDTVLVCIYLHCWRTVGHEYLRVWLVIFGEICYKIHRCIVDGKLAFDEDYVMHSQYSGFEEFGNLDIRGIVEEFERSRYYLDMRDKELISRYNLIKVI